MKDRFKFNLAGREFLFLFERQEYYSLWPSYRRPTHPHRELLCLRNQKAVYGPESMRVDRNGRYFFELFRFRLTWKRI